MRILVTGATGFVGRTLCELLAGQGYLVRAAVRTGRSLPSYIAEQAVVGDISTTTQWEGALEGVDAVMHLAARAHVLNDVPENERLYFETNVDGTERLVGAAVRSGVRKIVFLSSVKVNGEDSANGAYAATDEPHPQDAYGRSKWLAEQAVLSLSAQGAMDAAIVRAPLVYGPGVRANFLRLLRWVDRQYPLPLGAIHNCRSLVSVWNLSDFLMILLTSSDSANRTWMISDGEDLSTPELIRRIASSMRRRAHLLPVPPTILRACGALLGRNAELKRLCGSLAVDVVATREKLKWVPRISVDEGLARTAAWYLAERRSNGH